MGPGFPVAELVDDGLERDGPGGEALALAERDEGLGGGEEGLGGDEDPVGLVRRGVQRGRGSGSDLGLEEGLGQTAR